MRIAYIAPYQGQHLMQVRPTLLNLALAGNIKIELIADLLLRSRHEVEILSQGEVVERQCKLFPAFRETTPAPAKVPVFYSSALPIRFVNGFWSSRSLLRLFRKRHRSAPFDLVLLYNLKPPQVACALFAIQVLKLPVIVEYEDDSFVDIDGNSEQGLKDGHRQSAAQMVLDLAAGGAGVSPHLLSRFPSATHKLLLRGVVDDAIIQGTGAGMAPTKNWVVYSGTHYRSKGLVPLIAAWKQLSLPGWELHISGRGELTESLERMAKDDPSIVFHGMLSREDYIQFLRQAKIGINPHDVSHTPGNVFAFKIIEYLAAGKHVITTPMGMLEPELESAITYMPDNSAATLSATIQRVITDGLYKRIAPQAAKESYGPESVAKALETLVQRAVDSRKALD